MYKIYANELVEKIKLDLESKALKVDIKSEGKKVHKMLISKEVEDRDGEVISIEGINTKWYKKNPVVLVDHSYKIESIVGKTTKLYTEGKKMYADFVFANTEKAQILEEMYENGFINASSIGFMVEERNPNNVRQILKSELLEWSLVVAGSNREALKEKNVELFEKATKSGLLGEIKTLDTIQEEVKEVNELEEIKAELAEIKTILKSLADDKAKEKQAIEKEEAEIKAKKELLQSINKGISNSLEKIKLLK